jgi:hypothetical protein
VLSAALRATSTLTRLSLMGMSPIYGPTFDADNRAAVMVLGALTGHPSLRELKLGTDWQTHEAGYAAAGAALGALVAANAPALRTLWLPYCSLEDEGAGALVDALPHNTHLRTLLLTGNNLTPEFGHGRLLPAVRANSSLQHLIACNNEEQYDDSDDFEIEWRRMKERYALEAEALVAARAA